MRVRLANLLGLALLATSCDQLTEALTPSVKGNWAEGSYNQLTVTEQTVERFTYDTNNNCYRPLKTFTVTAYSPDSLRAVSGNEAIKAWRTDERVEYLQVMSYSGAFGVGISYNRAKSDQLDFRKSTLKSGRACS